MGAIDDFRAAIELLRREYDAGMTNMDNWCVVHATYYMPMRDENGQLYIPTPAMAMDYALPRATVHTTLNHIVTAHSGGSWDDCPYIIFAPYKKVVAENGNPLQISAFDTYFLCDPDKGLTLPEDVYLVHPSNDCLYSIGEHEATYKTENFTEEEIQEILSMDPGNDYYRLLDLNDWMLSETLSDPAVKAGYEQAEDKQEFIKNATQKRRNKILVKILRDTVVKLAMRKYGFEYISPSDEIKNIAQAAQEANIPYYNNNNGHFYSFIKKIEDGCWGIMCDVLEILNCGTDLNKIYDDYIDFKQGGDLEGVRGDMARSLIYSEPLNLYNRFTDYFANMHRYEDEPTCKTFAEYSPALDKTLRRCSDAMARRFAEWCQEIKKSPDYAKFYNKLNKRLIYDELDLHENALYSLTASIEFDSDIDSICNKIMEHKKEDDAVVAYFVQRVVSPDSIGWYDFYTKTFLGNAKCPTDKTIFEYCEYMDAQLKDSEDRLNQRINELIENWKFRKIYDGLRARLQMPGFGLQQTTNIIQSGMERH